MAMVTSFKYWIVGRWANTTKMGTVGKQLQARVNFGKLWDIKMRHIKLNLGIIRIEILRDPEKELELEERRLLLEVAKAKQWESSRREKMSVIESKFQDRLKRLT